LSPQKTHKWVFPARFRAGVYSWKSSKLASQRLREAVSEIKKVAKKDPVTAADGAVKLLEKLWPALEHIDSSSGALGSAVNKALDALIPIIVHAPAEPKIRDNWLERLWQAMEEDGVDYLAPVGDRWGQLCGSVYVANKWAENLLPTVRACWTDLNPGNYFYGTTACLSCLLSASRYEELLDLLALYGRPFWHYRRYGVDALLAMGKKSAALEYARASEGFTKPDAAIDRACEDILISSGLHQEAYRRYGLSAAQGNSYLARYRAVSKRYPMIAPTDILSDLIATTPGEEGKWFATAKELKLFDFALQLAERSPCEPKTLTRAARDFVEIEPVFAFGAAMSALRWLSQGWGYEVTGADVTEAFDMAIAAAENAQIDDPSSQIHRLINQYSGEGARFVRQCLAHRLSIH